MEKDYEKQRSGAVCSELFITRTFSIPRELVWRAWTESERLAKWWSPRGHRMAVSKSEFRPGGAFHFSLKSFHDGQETWGKFVYCEIVAPEKIVFINSFSDENGNSVRNPFSPHWPLEVMNTLTLIEQGGKTILTLRGVPINATEEEHRAFEESCKSMKDGFVLSWKQLNRYLEKGRII